MDFARTRISLRRNPLSYSKVQTALSAIGIMQLLSWLFRGHSIFIDRRRIRGREYLDVGCGMHPHSDFINLDYDWRPGIDVCWSVAKPLPFRNRTLHGIFSEHCLEHVPFEVCDFALSEFQRVLAPGGIVRIVMPDGALYLRRYAAGEPLPYGENEMSAMFSVNRVFRDYGHQFIYDFNTLRQMLERQGFQDIRLESFMQGRDPKLLIDTPARAIESFYVEAVSACQSTLK